jgi:lipopolysaccharide/colanic/teichoic acid biosynthesis glycosyltransferase
MVYIVNLRHSFVVLKPSGCRPDQEARRAHLMRTVDHTPRESLSRTDAVRLSPTRRILDLTVAFCLLVLLAPLLLLLAVLVRTTSGGPVLFRQWRVGEGGREFALYKFRTMRNGSAGPGITLGRDPRVTGAG